MTTDILFIARNRRAFTVESLAALIANTNWSLVRRLWICDDGSTDGTEQAIIDMTEPLYDTMPVMWMDRTRYGAPAAIMNAFVRLPDPPDTFLKLDNDVVVPSGYLDACAAVMEAHPELDLLGIEPPASRTPHYAGGPRSPQPEITGPWVRNTDGLGYAPTPSIGGIGLMRTRAFLENSPLQPHSIYGGFTEWQINHANVKKGWIVPPLPVFLLDRLPQPEWANLSKEYISRGWQREWSRYPLSAAPDLWEWWRPVGVEAVAPAR